MLFQWVFVFVLLWGAWILAWKVVFPDTDLGSRQYFITWLLAVGTPFVIGRFRRKPK